MVPFLDLKLQYESIGEEVRTAVLRVLESSRFVLGPEVEALEREFAEYCGAKYAVGVNSGTSALHLAFLVAGIGAGDEVITVPMTFVATVAAIRYTGAVPVFVDIHPVSYTMDIRRIEKAITRKTKVIVPVHLYGQAADMDPILKIAGEHGLVVIEDAAQAHGAEYKGRRAGSIGLAGCFSFYPGKNLGAYGEGGMVVTNDPEINRKVRMLRDWGAERKYHHVLKGYNYRMDGIQGAVLRVKLRHLEEWTEVRRTHATQYTKLLSGSGVKPPTEMPYARHVYHIYAVMADDRDQLAQSLRAHDVQCGMHYPEPVHLLEAHSDLGHKPGDFPVSEKIANEELSLPMFPELTEEQIGIVCEAVRG